MIFLNFNKLSSSKMAFLSASFVLASVFFGSLSAGAAPLRERPNRDEAYRRTALCDVLDARPLAVETPAQRKEPRREHAPSGAMKAAAPASRLEALRADIKRLGARDLSDPVLQARLKKRIKAVQLLLMPSSRTLKKLEALQAKRKDVAKNTEALQKEIQRSEATHKRAEKHLAAHKAAAKDQARSARRKAVHAERARHYQAVCQKAVAQMGALQKKKAALVSLRQDFYRQAVDLLAL